MHAPRSTILSSQKCPLSSLSTNSTTFPKSLKHHPRSPCFLSLNHLSSCDPTIPLATPSPPPISSTNTFHRMCYIVYDNIDTDQIISAGHLTLVPSKPDEYQKLGYFAYFILPYPLYQSWPVTDIVLNYHCGSSHVHAPVALGAAGVNAVVAESYARIFFRNSVATGEIYPLESEGRLCNECTTGDMVTVELKECKLINHTTGKEYRLKPIRDAGPVIEASGIFAYARKTGMIASK